MKQEIAERWAQALESGEYEQGNGRLREGNKFCCLGVLADLHRIETNGTWINARFDARFSTRSLEYLGNVSHLAPAVSVWAGLVSSGHSPRVDMGGYNFVPLIDLNDIHGKTFSEIAAIIREHWEKL